MICMGDYVSLTEQTSDQTTVNIMDFVYQSQLYMEQCLWNISINKVIGPIKGECGSGTKPQQTPLFKSTAIFCELKSGLKYKK